VWGKREAQAGVTPRPTVARRFTCSLIRAGRGRGLGAGVGDGDCDPGPPNPKAKTASGPWIGQRDNRRRHCSVGLLTSVRCGKHQLQTAQTA
jgi:hypothetical protein